MRTNPGRIDARQAFNIAAGQPWFYGPPSLPSQPTVVRVGPAFALIAATEYVVHVAPPDSGLHPSATRGDVPAEGAAMVLALVVLILVAGKVITRLIGYAVDRESASA